jgi:hypothetical protein
LKVENAEEQNQELEPKFINITIVDLNKREIKLKVNIFATNLTLLCIDVAI